MQTTFPSPRQHHQHNLMMNMEGGFYSQQQQQQQQAHHPVAGHHPADVAAFVQGQPSPQQHADGGGGGVGLFALSQPMYLSPQPTASDHTGSQHTGVSAGDQLDSDWLLNLQNLKVPAEPSGAPSRRRSSHQLEVLESVFKLCSNPSEPRRRQLGKMLKMDERQVMIWFQVRTSKRAGAHD